MSIDLDSIRISSGTGISVANPVHGEVCSVDQQAVILAYDVIVVIAVAHHVRSTVTRVSHTTGALRTTRTSGPACKPEVPIKRQIYLNPNIIQWGYSIYHLY